MNINQINLIKEVLGASFEQNYHARFKQYVVFSAEENAVNDEDLSDIIAKLLSNGFFPKIYKEDGRVLIHIASSSVGVTSSRVWINVVLFIITVFTTMMAGAVLIGKDYFADFSNIIYGWKYSLAVLTILTAHEFGHYFAARYHQISATLPYYIPLPLPGFHFGTLGAFIKIKSPIQNRFALLDVGAAGPISGFVVSLFFLILGYKNLPNTEGIIQFVETIHPWGDLGEGGINLVLGKSLLFAFFNDFLAGGRLPMNEVYHFPFIFAGWIGLLVTAINLMPIGQLDGGHILYALVGKRARLIGVSAFSLLIVLNFFLIIQYFSFVWVLWIILIFVLIGFRHPPTMNDRVSLNFPRMVTGWFCLGLFIICFPPLPLFIK
jgi:membrane-associated protease RseP (regulator of RpoE activity)